MYFDHCFPNRLTDTARAPIGHYVRSHSCFINLCAQSAGPSWAQRTHQLIVGVLLTLCSVNAWAQSPVQKCMDRAGSKTQLGTGDNNAHTRKLEANLWPRVVAQNGKPFRLRERMSYFAVPGVSVAVIHQGKIDWARGWGVRDVANCAPVTKDTRFQAASISKAVTAMLVMRLIEKGTLSLDTDINQSLRGWQLPKPGELEPNFVTLRQILSHTAGLTVHGFPGYPIDAPRPGIRQILDGIASANSPAVRIDHAPGSRFQYSGGGYTIAQLALEQASEKRFPQLAVDELLRPLRMKDSGFEQPPANLASDGIAAAHVQGRPVRGGFHVYPELAAAGLWSTPGDLARVLMDVQQAFSGKSKRRLSTATVRRMLTPQTVGWGLGFALQGDGDALRFGHDGVNEGFESSMVAYAAKGEGVVVMTNGQRGGQLADEIIRGIALDYAWSELAPRRITEVAVPHPLNEAHAGSYDAPGIHVSIEHDVAGLLARIGGANSERLLALSPTRFISQSSGIVIEFEGSGDGKSPSTGFRILEGSAPVLVPRNNGKPVLLGVTSIFLRGSMNDWSTATPVKEISPQVFAVEIELEAGNHEFKLASEDWGAVDLGVTGAAPDFDADSTPIALVPGGMNIRLSLKQAGKYRFVVDGSMEVLPILRISSLPPRSKIE